jgi:hypothetical protein
MGVPACPYRHKQDRATDVTGTHTHQENRPSVDLVTTIRLDTATHFAPRAWREHKPWVDAEADASAID